MFFSIAATEACNAVATGAFHDVKLAETVGKQQLILKDQFYQALAEQCQQECNCLRDSDKVLSNAVEALDPALFPVKMSPEFGETEIKYLCDKFGFGFSDIKFAYRDYKDSKGAIIAPPLLKLKCCVCTMPISTAECQRGFSKMNIICTPLRSRLSVPHISALMFISLTGPPITLFEPITYVKSWLALNRRSATSTQGPSRKSEEIANIEFKSL